VFLKIKGMKKKVYKLFFVWEYDKEEKWLNKMSAEGWQLIKGSSYRYLFERGEPNEYEYKLELLDEEPDSLKSKNYIDFLKEANIENVGKCRNWIFLRKKTADGGFSSDNKTLSHINHSLRVEEIYHTSRNTFILLLSIAFIGSFVTGYLPESAIVSFFSGFFMGIGISAAVLSLILMPIMRANFKKIKNYIRELYIVEGV